MKTKRNGKLKSAAALFLAGLLCLSAAAFLPQTQADAYDEVDEISVTVGYWGGTAYTKKKVSLSELARVCGTNQAIYTWINAGNSPGATEAEGIYISDIMNYCGIDMDSVYYYNFYTVDAASYGNARQQWTSDQLFRERYSYAPSFYRVIEDYNSDQSDFMENPERHYTVQNLFDFSAREYSMDAWYDKETVEPMLALRTKASQWKSFIPASKLDFTALSTTGRPILLFGQAGRNDITRNLQAQMVYQIHIWFNGSPEITLEAVDLNGKVGAKGRAKVSVTTPDRYLSEQILKDVELKSNNTKVAKVSKDGTVTITGKGNATITATYNGNVIGSMKAKGTGSKKNKDSTDNDDKNKQQKKKPGKGNGSGTSEGDGSGSSTGANTGSGAGTGKTTSSASGSGSNTVSSSGTAPSASSARMTVIPKRDDQPVNISGIGESDQSSAQEAGSAGGAASGSGDNDEKVYEISQPENVLTQSPRQQKVFRWVLLAVGLALLAGATGQTASYRSQMRWIKKAKRIYEKT